MLQDYITKLYHRIVSFDYITALHYRILLQNHIKGITELYYPLVGPPWALVGGTLVCPLGPCVLPSALVGRARALVGPLGPCGPPRALVGQVLMGSLWAWPWALWARMGRVLVGSLCPYG